MVHNRIEYAIMQLISEAYDLLHDGMGLNNDELAALFDKWNEGDLTSYLVEITAKFFKVNDEKTGNRLVDIILDKAGSKDTGKWTSQEALDLGVPISNIDTAVMPKEVKACRGGCIIRSSMLDIFSQAYEQDPSRANLLLDSNVASILQSKVDGLRQAVSVSAQNGSPSGPFMSSLNYYDAYLSYRMPTNLIQAQRDYFGSHTYQRVDGSELFSIRNG